MPTFLKAFSFLVSRASLIAIGVQPKGHTVVSDTQANAQAQLASWLAATYPGDACVIQTGGVLVADNVVYQPSGFTLAANPTSVTADGTAGGAPTTVITVAPLSGFAHTVTLSIPAALPAGVTKGFSGGGSIAGGSGTSTLTLTVAALTTPGTSNIVVVATDNAGVVTTITIPLVVT